MKASYTNSKYSFSFRVGTTDKPKSKELLIFKNVVKNPLMARREGPPGSSKSFYARCSMHQSCRDRASWEAEVKRFPKANSL